VDRASRLVILPLLAAGRRQNPQTGLLRHPLSIVLGKLTEATILKQAVEITDFTDHADKKEGPAERWFTRWTSAKASIEVIL